MDGEGEVDERMRWVERVLASPPLIHPDAPNGAVWSTEPDCYRFMADQVARGSHTLETGIGLSTVLFAAWGCDHLAVSPYRYEADRILEYCSDMGIHTHSLRFDIRPSDVALPALVGGEPLDLVFIDGCHGFPMPIIDWFYGAGRLRRGGTVVFDDLALPQVFTPVDTFLERDRRWLRLERTGKWAAYRRLSEGPLAEMEMDQEFYPDPRLTPWRRAKDRVPLNVKRTVRHVIGI